MELLAYVLGVLRFEPNQTDGHRKLCYEKGRWLSLVGTMRVILFLPPGKCAMKRVDGFDSSKTMRGGWLGWISFWFTFEVMDLLLMLMHSRNAHATLGFIVCSLYF